MYLPLYPKQAEFLDSRALTKAFVGGRGTGKSWIGIYDLLCRAKPWRTYTVADPTSVMMRDDTYPRFEKLARQLGAWGGVKLTPYPDVTLRNNALVRFRTADDPERMRGPDLSGLWLNEASLMHKDAFMIGSACLREQGERGWLTATFTPKGPTHWTYEEFRTGKPDTCLVRAATAENPFLDPTFEAALRERYGDTSFARQELGGEYVQIEGASFPAHWFDFPGFMFHDYPEGVTRRVLYLDPSQGEGTKEGDYQAYVLASFWPGSHNENVIYLECIAGYESVTEMVARGVRICREKRPQCWTYEVNGTMSFLHTEVVRQINGASMLQNIRPRTHTSKEPKHGRIKQWLELPLSQRRIRIRDTPGGRLLRAQLMDEPHSEHDDCADAAAGAVEELTGWVV